MFVCFSPPFPLVCFVGFGLCGYGFQGACLLFSSSCCYVIKAVIAPGFHLFPFRTEQLSPCAPMVLRDSGRVGRRRFFQVKPRVLCPSVGRGTLFFVCPFPAGVSKCRATIILSSKGVRAKNLLNAPLSGESNVQDDGAKR